MVTCMFRSIWHHYYQNTHSLIYVVDSSDRRRLPEAREILHQMLLDPELANVPLLVFANKKDVPNAMSAVEVTGI